MLVDPSFQFSICAHHQPDFPLQRGVLDCTLNLAAFLEVLKKGALSQKQTKLEEALVKAPACILHANTNKILLLLSGSPSSLSLAAFMGWDAQALITLAAGKAAHGFGLRPAHLQGLGQDMHVGRAQGS